MMHILGYCLSVFIGFSLGLIGGGGSILTIPVLVFFFNIDPVMATTYSLFIVGLTAICGSIPHYRLHNIDRKTIFQFGIPSVVILFIMRRWLIALIPSTIFHAGAVILTKPLFIMIVFTVIMLIAGITMIRKSTYAPSKEKLSPKRLALQGCITGAITGFIGVGGGFIIVPSLVLFAGLPVKKAIGTSLTIITINCLVGLPGNLNTLASLDYSFLLIFALFAILGMLAGTWVVRFIPDKKLKPAFGWIVLSMSIVVFIRIFTEH